MSDSRNNIFEFVENEFWFGHLWTYLTIKYAKHSKCLIKERKQSFKQKLSKNQCLLCKQHIISWLKGMDEHRNKELLRKCAKRSCFCTWCVKTRQKITLLMFWLHSLRRRLSIRRLSHFQMDSLATLQESFSESGSI